MKLRAFLPKRGAVALVALTCVSVLGLTVAAYFAQSNQSMRLSNRNYALSVSAQLAETGVEVALRAITTNDFSDWTSGTAPNQIAMDWTLSGTTATANLTLPAAEFGASGVVGSAKIRVDNHNAYNLPAAWSATVSYRLNDVVGSAGLWYRCVLAHTNQTPANNLTFWVPAPIPWTWSGDIIYALYSLVNYRGAWYRCIATTSTNQIPMSTPGSWVTVPTSIDWVTGTVYAVNDVIRDSSGALFRCVTVHTSSAAFATDAARWTSSVTAISTSWTSGTVYSRGSLVFTNGLWYYCVTAHTAAAAFATDLTAIRWATLVTNPPSTTWSGVPTYRAGDYVYSTTGPGWYRCIATHTNVAVTNPLFWSTTNRLPYVSWAWRSGLSYAYNDVVFYSASLSGTWYRCITAGASTPTTGSWENALSASWAWSSGDAYNIGDVVYSGTSFYRCIVAHTNQATSNATYWSASPLLSNAWDPGRLYGSNDTVFYNAYWYLSLQSSNAGNNPVATGAWAIAPRAIAAWSATVSYSIDDLVSSGGVWYRCIANHLNQAVSATAFWAPISGASNQWSAATAYAVNTYVNYGGAWYRCILDHTNQTPNNSTYWTASWAQSSGVTTGAPVIYAEGSAVLPGAGATTFTTLKTQFRALVAPAPLFPNAVAATDTVTIGGAGTVDSYDGSVSGVGVGGINTNFTYNQTSSPFTASAPNLGAAATIASTSTASTAIAGGTGTIQGYLAAPSATTAPYAPTSSFNGILRGGSTGTGIDLTRLSRSPFVPQPAFLRPIQHTALSTAMPVNVFLGTPGAPTPSVYYIGGSPTIGTNVFINGPVILYVNGFLRVNNGDTIYINSTGSLVVYSINRLRVESTSGGIINRSPSSANPDPKNLVIVSETTSSSTTYISYAGAAFTGVVYMRDTAATAGLRIASGVTIVGALSAKEITFSGAANVRYDTSLRYARIPGVEQIYQITELRELTNPAERIVLP